jgi:uncharacterized glyoxalase superfamily protein PhnB
MEEPLMSKVNPIPEGFNNVNIHMTVIHANEAIEFYKKAFGAEEICRMPGQDGKSVMHSELKIGNSTIMINDEYPGDAPTKSPKTLNGTSFCIHLYVEDSDAVYHRAVEAGCTVKMPLENQFWGDRYGLVTDPFGHTWGIASHTEDLSADEINERAKRFFSQEGGCH